jgi:Phage tail protein (Tail_P2_I)
VSRYDIYQSALHPPWLAGQVGEGWASALGILKDAWVENAVLAVRQRNVKVCSPDALAYHGSDRALERLPGENVVAYRARLSNAWTLWTYAGTKTGILAAVQGLGLAGAVVKENSDWAIAPSPGFSSGDEWWRFWVVVYPPHAWSAPWTVGDGTLVGAKAIGLQGDLVALSALQRSVAKWKAAHTVLTNIIIVLSGALVGGGWNVGAGTTIGGTAIYV